MISFMCAIEIEGSLRSQKNNKKIKERILSKGKNEKAARIKRL